MNYPKLDPELKEKWINVLRSGEYIQANGMLYDSNSGGEKLAMCCLGVLEHICGTPVEEMEGDLIMMPKDLDNPKSPEFLWGGDDYIIENPAFMLANMNDGNKHEQIKKHNFNEIADWIDVNL